MSKRRRATVIFLVAGSSTALCLAFWVWAAKTPFFAISEIKVSGETRITEEEIKGRIGAGADSNLFKISTKEAERRIKENPWIEKVKVSRRWPKTLHVDVTERRVRALAKVDRLYLADGEGGFIKEYESGDKLDLPVITGIGKEMFRENPALVSGILVKAMDLMEKLSGYEYAREISEIRVMGAGAAFTVVMEGGMSLVVPGECCEEEVLQDLRNSLQAARKTYGEIVYAVLVDTKGPLHVRPRGGV